MTLDSIEESNTTGYTLNIDDRSRIRLLLDKVNTHDIQFKYFLTLDYWFKMDKEDRLIKDNRHLKKILQKFFKSNIRMFFFNEKHQSGGFHRHVALEGIPESRWLNPTPQMETFMGESDTEMLFGCLAGVVPTVHQQMDLIKKVVKGLHHSTPNGNLGLNLLPIYNLEGLLSYCTKQNHHNIPHPYVIDTFNSSCLDDIFIRRLHAHIRRQTVPA